MKSNFLLGILLATAVASIPLAPSRAATSADSTDKAAATPAPDFTGADAWLNTEKPITIAQLKGQVVVLDFWTYCCINCMHVFPDLKFLEDKYKDQPVVVMGVHSGKFDEERDADHIRQAVLRHNISHPVAVDSEYKIWQAYGVHAWPTVLVIDSRGTIVQRFSGEGHRDELDQLVATLLQSGQKAGTLSKHLSFKSERESFKSGILEFPGKVLADAGTNRLFISDTNHNRVLLTDLNGKVSEVIGSGEPGLTDGGFTAARFRQPQGLALSADGQTLYVADTENHALRAVDLKAKSVATLAGDGRQSHEYQPDGDGKTTELSSPWDVARTGKTLYIAMAGTHQIWTYDLETHRVKDFAGTGREGNHDGPADQSWFAQPSGIVADSSEHPKSLYIADSEDSSIRSIALGPELSVKTLAGSGDLFGFGRIDGPGDKARFQHPLGVAIAPPAGDLAGTLYVADTFNGLIRTVNVKAETVATLAGSGKRNAGNTSSLTSIGLYEPGGLSLAGNTLFIADTNHHRIVAIDLKAKQVKVVEIGMP
jgi:DNA-binding beta-propeller fold protein YncE